MSYQIRGLSVPARGWYFSFSCFAQNPLVFQGFPQVCERETTRKISSLAHLSGEALNGSQKTGILSDPCQIRRQFFMRAVSFLGQWILPESAPVSFRKGSWPVVPFFLRSVTVYLGCGNLEDVA